MIDLLKISLHGSFTFFNYLNLKFKPKISIRSSLNPLIKYVVPENSNNIPQDNVGLCSIHFDYLILRDYIYIPPLIPN